MELNLSKDYLLVRPEEAKKETESGILLSKPQGSETWKGEVLGVGPDSSLSVGDVILFPTAKNGATPFRKDDEDYLLIREEVVYGVLG
jgi:chaperonin GroES